MKTLVSSLYNLAKYKRPNIKRSIKQNRQRLESRDIAGGSAAYRPMSNSTDEPKIAPQNQQGKLWHILLKANTPIDYNEEKAEAVIHHQGIPLDAYGRDGNPAIAKLMTYLFGIRGIAMRSSLTASGDGFLEYPKMTKDVLTFMVSSEIVVERAMYDHKVDNGPVDVKANLGYIGKTSLNTVTEVNLSGQGTLLMKNTNQVVIIDKVTRRPTAIPDWWREKYSSCTVRKQPLIVSKLTKPVDYHVCKLYVAWSDTDNYNHTNSASYPRFAIDGIRNALSANFFKRLSKADVDEGVKKIQMAYLGESEEGDLLQICVWEDDKLPIAYCDFLKGSNTVFQCIVEFHNFRDSSC